MKENRWRAGLAGAAQIGVILKSTLLDILSASDQRSADEARAGKVSGRRKNGKHATECLQMVHDPRARLHYAVPEQLPQILILQIFPVARRCAPAPLCETIFQAKFGVECR